MPCVTLPVDASGRPLIEIGISSARSLLPAGAAPPVIHWVNALIDTGCTITSVYTAIAAQAELPILGKGSTNTANGTVACNLFHGDLFIKIPLPNGQVYEYRFADRRILELCVKPPAFDALLGMDMLMRGTFHVNGITKNATFCW